MLAAALLAAAIAAAPAPQSHPSELAGAAAAWSCATRRLCTQIATCEEAQWYLRQCRWGSRLDGDHDGIPCESLCGSAR